MSAGSHSQGLRELTEEGKEQKVSTVRTSNPRRSLVTSDKYAVDQRGPAEEIKTFAGHQIAALPWFSDKSVLASKSIFQASAGRHNDAVSLVLGTIAARR